MNEWTWVRVKEKNREREKSETRLALIIAEDDMEFVSVKKKTAFQCKMEELKF